MKNIFFVIILLIATSAFAEDPTTAYGWVDSYGVESFTDRDEAVPAKYLEDVESVTLDGIEGYEKLTSYKAADTLAYRAGLADRLAELRSRRGRAPEPAVEACDGHILVTSQRIQDGDYNRRIFVVTDECGRTASVTSHYPDVQINR